MPFNKLRDMFNGYWRDTVLIFGVILVLSLIVSLYSSYKLEHSFIEGWFASAMIGLAAAPVLALLGRVFFVAVACLYKIVGAQQDDSGNWQLTWKQQAAIAWPGFVIAAAIIIYVS